MSNTATCGRSGQVRRAALAAHPRDQLGEDQRGDELALVVRQVRRGHDRAAPPPVGRVQHRLDVERRAHRPRRERRRRQQPVELHRQRHAVVGGEELVDVEHAQLADRRRRDHADERHQIQRAALAPGVVDQVRQQDVLAARQRVGGDADQAEQPGDVPLDLVGDHLGVTGVIACILVVAVVAAAGDRAIPVAVLVRVVGEVPDVGDVLNVVDLVAAEPEPADDRVEADVALRVAEVAVAVDGRATDVNSHVRRIERLKFLALARQAVVYFESHYDTLK